MVLHGKVAFPEHEAFVQCVLTSKLQKCATHPSLTSKLPKTGSDGISAGARL
jgi:hypothetical protein